MIVECGWCGQETIVSENDMQLGSFICPKCWWIVHILGFGYPVAAETQDIKHYEWITRCKETE